MITLSLSEEQAVRYRQLLEAETVLSAMREAGALGLKNAQVILNYDKHGTIGSIEVKQYWRPSYQQGELVDR